MELFILTLFSGFASFTKFFLALLTVRIYLTWFPNINMYTQPFVTLGKMTDPYLRLFRGLIPPVFGFDLSPLLSFLLLTFLEELFTNVASVIKG